MHIYTNIFDLPVVLDAFADLMRTGKVFIRRRDQFTGDGMHDYREK